MRTLVNNFLILATVVTNSFSSNQLARLKQAHRAQTVTADNLQYLSGLTDTDHIDTVLDNILIPRVVGTPNHDKVFDYIRGQLSNHSWTVDVDEFEETAPLFGRLTFKNIVATLNSDAERYLVLACHYDSKYFENDVFVGATDSAVPCAMLLNMAKVMSAELDQLRNQYDLGLKFMFFDGEEAFENWGPTDSIYGARHLAKSYDESALQLRSGQQVSKLDQIDVLVLLDLLGAADPVFYSFFRNTENWYLRLANIEERLTHAKLLEDHPSKYFKKQRTSARIEDDHLPFLRKNVPILHLIPVPFPTVWHTADDNRDVVDMKAVENLNKILRVFVAEYLHLLPEEQPDKRKLRHTEF